MLFMIVERFRNADPVPVYRRFRDQGRLAPADVAYVGSWVTADLSRCFKSWRRRAAGGSTSGSPIGPTLPISTSRR